MSTLGAPPSGASALAPRAEAPARRSARGAHGRLVALVAGGAVVLATSNVLAHSVGVSRGDYALEGTTLSAELSFAEAELAERVTGLDGDANGDVDAAELDRGRALVERAIVAPIVVRSARGPCPGALTTLEPAEQDGVTIRARFECDARTASISLDLGFLTTLAHGHRHLATATADGALTHAVAHAAATKLALAIPGAAPDVQRAEDGTSSTLSDVRAGLEALHGFELALFVLAAALAEGGRRGRTRALVAISVAIGAAVVLATLTAWSPPARFVEPAIALGLVYVGLDNMLVRAAPERTWALLPLGAAFGLGIARSLGGHTAGLTFASVAAVVAVAVIAAVYLRRARWFGDEGVRLVSGVVAAAGLWWLVERVVRA